jgi:hypothetical protein
MSVSDERRSFFGQELQSEIKRLVSDSISKSSYALLRSVNLVKAIVSQKPQQKVVGIELAERWARFNLETLHIINQHNQEAINEILDTLEHYGFLGPPPSKPGAQTKQKETQPKMEIKLSARKGETVKTSFIVANPSGEEMEASFAVTEFVNEDGHLVPATGVQFFPATLRLLPDQEVPVQVAVKVDQKFKVDKIYIAKIQLPGHPNKDVALKLQVVRSPRKKSATSNGTRTQKKDGGSV